MNTDLYFDIGTSHTICQDYALSETDGDDVAVFLSDGCSSSVHTDIGARFLCLAAAQQWRRERGVDSHTAANLALSQLRFSDLPLESLDATLLTAYQERNGVRVRVWGDGVVAARDRKTGETQVYKVNAPLGAPDYPSYQLSRARLDAYLGYIADTPKVVVGPEGSTNELPCAGLSLYFPADAFDVVAIMSDGAASFQRQDERGRRHPVSVEEVVSHVMNIRGHKGEFVVRTVRNVFLKRYCVREGWTHYDDFAVAAIYIPKEET